MNRIEKTLLHTTALLLLAMSPLKADEKALPESPVELDDIIVSARGYETTFSETPGGIGVVEERTVFESLPVSIPDLDRYIPGVTKNADGSWGSDINIRGLSRDSVVVLVDGSRIETGNAINARLGFIDPSTIQRVEVLKGPISSLYGSGSLGGVVNIITKGATFTDAEEWSAGSSLSVKSNPSGFSGAIWGSWTSPTDYVFAQQTYRDFDSYEDGDGNEMLNSQFTDWQTAIKAGHLLNANNIVEAQFQYFEGKDIGVPAGSSSLPAQGQTVTYPETTRGLVDIKYSLLPEIDAWEESELKLYYHFNRRNVVIENFPAAAPIYQIRPDADHDTYGLQWQNWVNTAQHAMVGGLNIWNRDYEATRKKELRNGKILEDKPLPDCSYLSAGAYAEDSWLFSKKFSINYGARMDFISVENDAVAGFWEEESESDESWNAHIGAVYKLTDELSTKAIVSSGYRAASLEERYSYIALGGNAILNGDPELDPEQSVFSEWGLDWKDDRLEASASTFFNQLDDMIIIEDIGTGPDQTYANVSEAQIFGFEMDASWKLCNALNVYGNLAYLNGRDLETNDDLPGIAPINGLLGLRGSYDSGIWSTLEAVFACEQDHTPTGTDPAEEWVTVNARIGYDFGGSTTQQTIFIGIDNALDEMYYNYLSTSRSGTVVLYEPGRSVNAGWQVQF